MATWQHLRSSTANKRPTTSLADGRIAINTNTASPGLFFKDSAGTGIVKVGPVHVGTTAPNSVPASGGSTGNYTGEQWLDTSVSPAQMKVWNGSTWVGIVADELPVSKLQDGAARQLIQTDAAGTGVEWTSNVDVPGTLDVTSTATFDSIAQHPLGTAGAPTITFTGDTNTGIYSPGADQVAISTNGVGRLFVASDGKIGVGSSGSGTQSALTFIQGSGACPLEIDATAGSGGYLTLSNNGSAKAFLGFGSNIGTASVNDIALRSQSGAIAFQTGGATERMRLDSSGRLGLGTSTVNANLHVFNTAGDSEIRITAKSTNQGILRFGNEVDQTLASIRFDSTDDSFRFYGLNDTERVRISGTGAVGIGTTSPVSKLHVDGDGFFTDWLYFTNSKGVSSDSTARPLLFGIQGSEKARLDTSGRLLVGTSSAVALNGVHAGINIHGNSENPAINFMRAQNAASITDNSPLGFFQFGSQDGGIGASIFARAETGWSSTSDCPSRLVFSTTADGASSPTERMRITNGGTTSTFTSAGNAALWVGSASAAGTSVQLIYGAHSASGVITGTNSFTVWTNGNVVNTNNSYGSLSDIKLKENIVNASSQWNDLKALQIRKYNLKEETGQQTHTQIGLIAQEVELVSPGLVSKSPDRDEDGNDLGTVTKSVNYSVLYMKAVKALQEAMERIETLEAKVAALEGV
jgi:hypothetical protein